MNAKGTIIFCTTLILFIGFFSFADGTNFALAEKDTEAQEKEDEKALELKTVIGDGETGHRDGSYGWARFFFPRGLELIETDAESETEAKDDLILADTQNQRLRSVEIDKDVLEGLEGLEGLEESEEPEELESKELDAEVTTLAGDPPGFDDYGFPAGRYVDADSQEAQFNQPRDIVADSEGRLYISDAENHVIRRLSDGEVTTFAGSGEAGFKDERGLEAKFDTPSGMDVDTDDNIFVADTMNDAIRMITPDGEVKSLEVNFNEPYDVVVDEEYEAERAANISGDGAAAGDNSGFLYVSDSGNQRIWEIDIEVFHDASELDELEDSVKKATQEIEELLEEREAKEEIGGLEGLEGLETEKAQEGTKKEGTGTTGTTGTNGAIEVTGADDADAKIEIYREHLEDYGIRILAGRGADELPDTDYIVGGDMEGPFETARFNFPKGITISDTGVILVADSWNQKIKALSREDEMVRTVYAGELQGPMDLAYDNEDKLLYVSDMWNNQIFAFEVDEKILQEKLDYETFDMEELEVEDPMAKEVEEKYHKGKYFHITDLFKSRTWLNIGIVDGEIWQEILEQVEFD